MPGICILGTSGETLPYPESRAVQLRAPELHAAHDGVNCGLGAYQWCATSSPPQPCPILNALHQIWGHLLATKIRGVVKVTGANEDGGGHPLGFEAPPATSPLLLPRMYGESEPLDWQHGQICSLLPVWGI